MEWSEVLKGGNISADHFSEQDVRKSSRIFSWRLVLGTWVGLSTISVSFLTAGEILTVSVFVGFVSVFTFCGEY